LLSARRWIDVIFNLACLLPECHKFLTGYFAQWKVFVGALLSLSVFHFVVSFVLGRLPTSTMLCGMAIEFAEKQKLGVLLVMCCVFRLRVFYYFRCSSLFFPPILQSTDEVKERTTIRQAYDAREQALRAKSMPKRGTQRASNVLSIV
jgi:hypothetical protein